MATILGRSGSLTELIRMLNERGIHSLQSLEEVIFFKNDYRDAIDRIKDEKKSELNREIDDLKHLAAELSVKYDALLKQREFDLTSERHEIETWLDQYASKKSHFLFSIVYWFKFNSISRRLTFIRNKFNEEKVRPLIKFATRLEKIKKEFEDKEQNIDRWIDVMSEKELERLNFINSVIDDHRKFLLGAIGEKRAADTLQKLPDSYIVINDFQKNFISPVYDRRNDDRIYSTQIDHVVVGPKGVFIIETKNWSQKSVDSYDFFSPIKQLHRANFALFVILNQAVETGMLRTFNKHWGAQKISPKNIVLMMQNKPTGAFQYVKVLLLSEVNRYITYGENIFSPDQISELSRFLANA